MTPPSLGSVLRLAVAVGLTGYVLWHSNPGEVARTAAGADLSWVALAVVLVIVDRALMAVRWLTLLCNVPAPLRPSLWAAMRIFFVSTFIGTFLPASVGADAVRAYSLSRREVAGADALASVLMDRALGILSLLILGLFGLLIARELADDPVILVSLALTAAGCAALAALIYSRRADRLARALFERVPWGTLRRLGLKVVTAVQRYSAYHRELTIVLLGSIGVQAVRMLEVYALGRALDITAPFTVYVAFVPIIVLVMLLPVTMSGLGTGQAAFVWFFGQVGVGRPEAFALSVLFVALSLVGNLPGGVLYAWGGLHAPPSDAPQSDPVAPS